MMPAERTRDAMSRRETWRWGGVRGRIGLIVLPALSACSDSSTGAGGTGTDDAASCATTGSCPAPDQCHEAGICDPMTGRCTNPSKADGTACDDGSLCTQMDSCQAGACVG